MRREKMKSLDRHLLIVLVQLHHGGTEPRGDLQFGGLIESIGGQSRPCRLLRASVSLWWEFWLQPFHNFFERPTSVLVVLELVEAGAGWG
jgi:hypothetical protein